MPPLAGIERPDGVVERTITVGLRPVRGGAGHEIVGVRLGRREVVRLGGGAPPTALAAARRCGAPYAEQPTTMNRAGAAQVAVKRGGETLWRLVVVRPAASSGEVGSGVELRVVSYRGARPASGPRADRPRVRPSRRAFGCARNRPPRSWTAATSRAISPASPSTSTARRWCWSASLRRVGTAT